MASSSYNKRPFWQWVVIYLVAGAVIYGLVYYFVFAKSAGYSSNAPVKAPAAKSGSDNY